MGEPKSALDMLKFVIANPGAMADMGVRGRAVYENLYSTEENLKKLMEIYEGVLAAKGEPRAHG